MKYSDFVMFPNVVLNGNEPFHLASGKSIEPSQFCKKHFGKDQSCIKHYNSSIEKSGWIPCPFGYSSYFFEIDGVKCAVTGVIPFPRIGTSEERLRAKISKEQKVTRTAVETSIRALNDLNVSDKEKVGRELSRNMAALHEVRKYNRNLVQTLERYCKSLNPQDPDRVAPELVRAWKLAELMSYQFEILSLIADENLVRIPPKTKSDVYKMLDKCIRVFRPIASDKGMRLDISGDTAYAIVSDKTFPMMATVLIENAIKYGAKDGRVDVNMKIINQNKFRVSVTNDITKETILPKNPFLRGARGSDDKDGTGVGLYLAQMVAKQHRTKIEFEVIETIKDFNRITFSFVLDQA